MKDTMLWFLLYYKRKMSKVPIMCMVKTWEIAAAVDEETYNRWNNNSNHQINFISCECLPQINICLIYPLPSIINKSVPANLYIIPLCGIFQYNKISLRNYP